MWLRRLEHRLIPKMLQVRFPVKACADLGGCRFNPQFECVQSLVRVCTVGNQLMFLSLPSSPSKGDGKASSGEDYKKHITGGVLGHNTVLFPS